MAELIVLLDLGSNAVRFVLARVKPGVGFRVLRQVRTQTRLGGGRPGTLPREAVDDTLRAVRRFLRGVYRDRAESGDERPLRFIAIATAAVRDAVNRDHLLGPLRRKEGIDVRVLTGPEEARLAASAAIEDLPRRFHGVIADLGGGSLQLTTVRRGRIARTASVPLGTVRMTRRFVHADPPEPRELRALRAEIRRQMDAVLPTARRGDEIVGLGGTIRTLARMHLVKRRRRRRHRQGLRLDQADITAIRGRLEAVSLRQRRELRGLTAERADTILAGAIVVEETLMSGGYPTLIISTRGVRDGVLLREAFGAR
jgi:exopolyphosphatase / guanosine-5'-triphosphate,3'-diphosphate pyrophosphatase